MKRLASVLPAILLACAVSHAQEQPPAGGQETPKTPEEILWEKIWLSLEPLKKVMEEPDYDKQDAIWKKAEEDLFALGESALPLLETLIYKFDEKGLTVFPAKLKEFLGREDDEAERLIERVMRRHRWVSEADKTQLAGLLAELRAPECEVNEIFIQFADLGWFGVDGLRKEYSSGAANVKQRILGVMRGIASLGSADSIDFLLDLSLEKEPETRRAAVESLLALSDYVTREETPQEQYAAIEKVLKAEGAYETMAGFLRLDPDADVRFAAARFFRWLKVREVCQELVNALDDPKDRVADEALNAIERIAGDAAKGWSEMKYDVQVKNAKAWWKKVSASFPKQIKAEPPARRKKAPEDQQNK